MSDDTKARLAALRAERADLEAAREAKASEQALSDELETEARAVRELKALDALETEHGPLGKKLERVDTGEGMIVVKRPHGAVYRRFVELEHAKTEDVDRFVRPCVVYPDKAEFNRIVEEEPAALIRCASACAKLAGVRKNELSGK